MEPPSLLIVLTLGVFAAVLITGFFVYRVLQEVRRDFRAHDNYGVVVYDGRIERAVSEHQRLLTELRDFLKRDKQKSVTEQQMMHRTMEEIAAMQKSLNSVLQDQAEEIARYKNGYDHHLLAGNFRQMMAVIDTIDEFERGPAECPENVTAFFDGLRSQIRQTLETWSVTEIPREEIEGRTFDDSLARQCEVIRVHPVHNPAQHGVVIDVIRRGYVTQQDDGHRLLRPVGVQLGKSVHEAEGAGNPSNKEPQSGGNADTCNPTEGARS